MRTGPRTVSIAIAIVAALLVQMVSSSRTSAAPTPPTSRTGETVRVIVGIRGGEAGSAARQWFASSLDRLGGRIVHEYETIPYVLAEVDTGSLAALESSSLVTSVRPDGLSDVTPQLEQTTATIGASVANSQGHLGYDQTVVVMDTGVQADHAFLGGAIRDEYAACFGEGNKCPNGSSEQFGPGSAVPCRRAENCDHGTHMAGIVAGRPMFETDSHGLQNYQRGVAPGARIIPVRTLQTYEGQEACGSAPVDPCAASIRSDIVKALDYTIRLKWSGVAIAAVNMSFGSGAYKSRSECDAVLPAVNDALRRLRAANVAPVVSAGNESDPYADHNAMGWPACVTGAVSVAASGQWDEDIVTEFAMATSFTDLFAPGWAVRSSVPGNQWAHSPFQTKDGASQSAAHVSGAWAILKQIDPHASVDAVLSVLKSTGKPVSGRPDVPARRIDVLAASQAFGVRISDAQVTEGPRQAAWFTIRLQHPSNTTQTLHVLTTDGTARAGSDYTSSALHVQIPAGQTSATFGIPIHNDMVGEPTETFTVKITQATSGAGRILVTRAIGTATIIDDENGSPYRPPSGGYA